MRYLRPVRIDEKKSKGQIARAEKKDARQTLILKRHKVLDSTGPRKMAERYRSAQLSGDQEAADKVRADAVNKKKIMRQKLARGSTAGDRYTLAELQPRKESFIPLTLPNIMEINIVKGPDGKPRLASGNGTTLRTNRGPRVKSAMDILNRGEELTPAGAKSLKNAEISMGNTRALQPSKFLGKRHRTSVRKRGRPSSGGHGGDYEGVDMARDSAENRLT